MAEPEDPTVVAGGIVGQLTSAMFGDPDEETRGRMNRSTRRREFRDRVRTVQELAITVAIVIIAIAAVFVLARLYFLIQAAEACT
jgi:hypothetical protein